MSDTVLYCLTITISLLAIGLVAVALFLASAIKTMLAQLDKQQLDLLDRVQSPDVPGYAARKQTHATHAERIAAISRPPAPAPEPSDDPVERFLAEKPWESSIDFMGKGVVVDRARGVVGVHDPESFEYSEVTLFDFMAIVQHGRKTQADQMPLDEEER
jgi:hypothetical protein